MWETLFDSFMLNAFDKIAINCPTEELERELADILDEFGYRYPDGTKLGNVVVWGSYEENFCYYVQGTVARRGPKSSATEHLWREYKKCTFYGADMPDFDIATDDELRSFLGV